MKLLTSKSPVYKFIRFSFVGVINTVVDLSILNLLVYLFGVVDPFYFSICKSISFAIAVIGSFFMNKYFTFNKKTSSAKDFYIFVLISTMGLFVNIVISGLMFYFLGSYQNIVSIHLIATISGIIGSIFTMFINYISYSYFVFK